MKGEEDKEEEEKGEEDKEDDEKEGEEEDKEGEEEKKRERDQRVSQAGLQKKKKIVWEQNFVQPKLSDEARML